MGAMIDYVNDIIQQAYNDGASGVSDHTEITYLTKEDVDLLIREEIASGAHDEYLQGFLEDMLAERGEDQSTVSDEEAISNILRSRGVLLEGLVGPSGSSGFQFRVDPEALDQPVMGRVGASSAFLFDENGSLVWIGLY